MTINAWDKRPGESSMWHRRFVDYLHMDRPRSLARLANEWRDKVGRKRQKDPPGSWRKHFHEEGWAARAEAWDVEQARLDEERYQDRRRKLNEKRWEASGALFNVVKLLLENAPRFLSRRDEIVYDDNGSPMRVITMEMKASGSQMAQMARAASDLGKESVGEPDRIALTDTAGRDLLDDGELLRRAVIILEEDNEQAD